MIVQINRGRFTVPQIIETDRLPQVGEVVCNFEVEPGYTVKQIRHVLFPEPGKPDVYIYLR